MFFVVNSGDPSDGGKKGEKLRLLMYYKFNVFLTSTLEKTRRLEC